ncbi:MAG TPA: co-chaperone DjlA, partial [Gammaproteobacteria bacterium]
MLIGAVLGLLAGGTRGILLGAALGWAANWLLRQFIVNQAGTVQSQFLESTFAVMGALCKADGVVTRNEIGVAQHIFDQLHLSAAQREDAKAAFNRGKSPDFD